MPSPEMNPAPAPLHTKRTWLRRIFRVVLIVLIPLMLLVGLEGGLRLFGYGHDTAFLIRRGDVLENNTRFGWRFFAPAISREAGAIHLSVTKPANTYRAVILGGSAAQGVPDDTFAFGRFMEVMLRDRYPSVRFEVINAAMTAVNSHVMLQVARDVTIAKPDLFIVYMGNNEVVGPFGAGTVFMGYSPSLRAIRAGLWAKSIRLGQLADSIARGMAGEEPVERWGGMKMLGEQRVGLNDPRLVTTQEHFRRNLSDICQAAEDAGAGVILCTVPVNLRHNAPFASVHSSVMAEQDVAAFDLAYEQGASAEAAGQVEKALQHYQDALALDATFADLHFRMGRCYLSLGDAEKAREHFIQAREHDALRFRADNGINARIRDVAAAWGDRGVSLVDAERVFADSEHTVAELPGEELFYEHVHMNPLGSYELGRAVFLEVVRRLPESVASQASSDRLTPSFQHCAEWLALTQWDRSRHLGYIWGLTKGPPFSDQLDYRQTRQRLLDRRLDLWREPWSVERIAAVYDDAIRAVPDDPGLRRNAATALSAHGDYVRASEHLHRLLALLPNDPTAHWGMGTMYLARSAAAQKAGNQPEAQRNLTAAGRHLRRYVDLLERRILGPETVVKSYWKVGRFGAAESICRWSLAKQPNSPQLLTLLATTLYRKGDQEGAFRAAERAVEIAPMRAAGWDTLGQFLLLTDRPAEAVEHCSRAVELDSYLAPAHANLAAALLKMGDSAGAMASLARAVDLAPNDAESLDQYGQLLEDDGQFSAAAEAYRQALLVEPMFVSAAMHLTWLLATSDDADTRDPVEALELGQETTRRAANRPEAWISMAAAQAANGQFDQAIDSAGKALSLARQMNLDALAEEIARHIEHYRRREVAPADVYPNVTAP